MEKTLININDIEDLRKMREKQTFVEAISRLYGFKEGVSLSFTTKEVNWKELKNLDLTIIYGHFEIYTTNDQCIVKVAEGANLTPEFVKEKFEQRKVLEQKKNLEILLDVFDRAEKNHIKLEKKKEKIARIKNIPKRLNWLIKGLAH